MRLIGELKDFSKAQTFSDYLTQLGIENNLLEETEDNQPLYEIWVHSEDEVTRTQTLFNEFLGNPNADKYEGVSKKARKIKKQAEKEAKEKPLYMDARTTIFNRAPTRSRPLTLLLIVICVGVAILSRLGDKTDALNMLFITKIIREGNNIGWIRGLPEIFNGEIWRLFTPIFIHFGPLHLVFNMLWLKDLGSMVEDRKGSLFLAIFILIVAGVGNCFQFWISHPLFGGMSGVVYGLLGYIWIKGKYDPSSQLYLHKTTVGFMIFWFFFCLTGLAGNIANGTHAAGLIIGIVWGYISSGKMKQHLKNLKNKGI